jgi:hypothetical protein
MNVDALTFNAHNQTTFPGFTARVFTLGDVSMLPTPIVKALYYYLLPGLEPPPDEFFYVPCWLKQNLTGSFDFKFGDLTINVPLKTLIAQRIDEDGHERCYLSVRSDSLQDEGEHGIYYLGYAFLRAAYAVFDQDNKAVWLAEHIDCGNEVVGLTKDNISGITGQCGGTDATASPTLVSGSTPTSSTSASTSSDKGNGANGLNPTVCTRFMAAVLLPMLLGMFVSL